jgi:TonB family protein
MKGWVIQAPGSPSDGKSSDKKLRAVASRLEARFTGHALPLRYIASDRHLRYDESGKPLGTWHPGRWARDGYVEVRSVEFKAPLLIISANRGIVSFSPPNYQIAFVPRSEKIQLEISVADMTIEALERAFERVFIPDNDLPENLEDYWKPFLSCLRSNNAGPCNSAKSNLANSVPSGAFKVGIGVTAPKVSSRVEPQYNEEARLARIQGTVVLEGIVQTDGRFRVVRIIRPLGFGLDEAAVDALAHWTFEPGRKNGAPVDVSLNVEVNFNLGQ